MDEVTRRILSDPGVQHQCRIRSKVHACTWLRDRINRDPDTTDRLTLRYPFGSGRIGSVALQWVAPRPMMAPVGGTYLTAYPMTGTKEFKCNGVKSDSLAEALLIGYLTRQLLGEENDSSIT